MSEYGVFINYRHERMEFATMIYAYLKGRGIDPFWDVDSLEAGEGNYNDAIENVIREAPVFLCVLTGDCLSTLSDRKTRATPYYQELEIACAMGKPIYSIASDDFNMPSLMELPPEIRLLYKHHYRRISPNHSNFNYEMKRLLNFIDDHIDLDWRERARQKAKTLVLGRFDIETQIASFKDRFGEDLARYADEQAGKPPEMWRPFSGKCQIERLCMACYAANLIYNPKSIMVDSTMGNADKFGRMFHIFRGLLCAGSSVELIINTPESPVVDDAIRFFKLGNSAFSGEEQRAIFLAPYFAVQQLMREDEVYKEAAKNKRFHFRTTDCYMPCAIVWIKYGPEWEEFDHIKIDIYSTDIGTSTAVRRSMIFFKRDDPTNYGHFVEQYGKLRKFSVLPEAHKAKRAEWRRILRDCGVDMNALY